MQLLHDLLPSYTADTFMNDLLTWRPGVLTTRMKKTLGTVLTREKDILLGLVEAKTHMIVQNYNYAS